MSDIELITKSVYVTPDGVEHASMLLAEHHLAHQKVEKTLELHDFEQHNITEILNIICSQGTRQKVRALLDVCERMEQAHG